MTQNSARFVDAYNRIDSQLKKLTNHTPDKAFSKTLEAAQKHYAHVRPFDNRLRQYAQLRNAIVHDSKNNIIIAEPHDSVVDDIEIIADTLDDPPRVTPMFQRDVVTESSDASLQEAVRVMAENSFSQLPISDDGRIDALLTSNTITRWLGRSANDAIFSTEETPIREVLDYQEDYDVFAFVARDTTQAKAVELFHEYATKGKRLEAILITHSGNSRETPIGIMTNWDIPSVSKNILP